jgi:hypothetical protein
VSRVRLLNSERSRGIFNTTDDGLLPIDDTDTNGGPTVATDDDDDDDDDIVTVPVLGAASVVADVRRVGTLIPLPNDDDGGGGIGVDCFNVIYDGVVRESIWAKAAASSNSRDLIFSNLASNNRRPFTDASANDPLADDTDDEPLSVVVSP